MPVLALTIFSSCDNEHANEADIEAENFETYVDSVGGLDHRYNDDGYWGSIESGYTTRHNSVLVHKEELSEEANQKVAKAEKDYEMAKADYEKNRMEARNMMAMQNQQKLRDSLFGAGNLGADMALSFVTADNIRVVYENFVSTVQANKETYSREDWDEIKNMYEALGTRKNEVEKNLKTSDNLEIAKEKVKFASIKATHRPGAKFEENDAAK